MRSKGFKRSNEPESTSDDPRAKAMRADPAPTTDSISIADLVPTADSISIADLRQPGQNCAKSLNADSIQGHSLPSCSGYDLLIILIRNHAFVRTLGLPSLNRLPRLARQFADILSLVANDHWMDRLYHHLEITDPAVYQIASTNSRVVMEGICALRTRSGGYPQSRAAYQKEILLWWAYALSPDLESDFGSLIDDAVTKGSPHHCLDNVDTRPDKISALNLQDQFRLFDCLQILRTKSCPTCIRNIRQHQLRGACIIARFENHPLHIPEHMSQLLPHEYLRFERSQVTKLTLIDCSFESLSGWPQALNALKSLTIVRTSMGRPIENLKSMPFTPRLECLVLPDTFRSFAGADDNLTSLKTLDLGACTRLTSLKDMTPLPKLQRLTLPRSSHSLVDVPDWIGKVKVSKK